MPASAPGTCCGVGLDLGLPTGALAGLAATEAEQNGHLARRAARRATASPTSRTTTVGRQLAVHLAASPAVVVERASRRTSIFEFPPAVGRIPPHRTDAGAFSSPTRYGARRTIYRQGRRRRLHRRSSTEPVGPSAELRDKVGASELLRAGASLPIDRVVLELMGNAKHVTEIQIVNGLTPGALTRALRGEPVGTVVHTG